MTLACYAPVSREVKPPRPSYLLTAAGIVVSLGMIAATFPLLRRITGPEVARNE